MPTHEELILRFGRADDPEIDARRQHILSFLLQGLKARELTIGWVEGELTEARASVRRVLAIRGLTPSKDDDARIEACADVETLHRWHSQAVTAARVSDALA